MAGICLFIQLARLLVRGWLGKRAIQLYAHFLMSKRRCARCDWQPLQAKCGIGAGWIVFFHALGTSFEIPNALCSLVSCLLFLSSLGVALAIASRRCVPAFLDGVKVSRTPLVLASYTLCWVAREVGPWSCFVNVCVCVSHVGLLTCRVWQYIISSDSGLLAAAAPSTWRAGRPSWWAACRQRRKLA